MSKKSGLKVEKKQFWARMLGYTLELKSELFGAIMWFCLSFPHPPQEGGGTSIGGSRFVPPFWEKGDQDLSLPRPSLAPVAWPDQACRCLVVSFFSVNSPTPFRGRRVDADLVP